MLQQLINHSPDLKRLRDEGYEVEVRGGYLLVHHIPYVNQNKIVRFGTLVSNLTIVGDTITAPNTHVIYFAGDHPCNMDGTIIYPIQHSSQPQNFGEGIVVHHSFSNKPPEGYPDQYQKVKRYADIISAPAKEIDDSATERTYKLVHMENSESIFKYVDTNSSRANINAVNAKLEGQRIAIIGIGGTGAYLLDLVAKTPVQEIHVYDGDQFLQHNAFRSPGAPAAVLLAEGRSKAEYFADIYSNMHNGIVPHNCYVKAANIEELNQMNFVFICVDNNAARHLIINHLLSRGIKFIDVGLGVNLVGDKLIGGVRVTAATPEKQDHLHLRIPAEDNDNNEYATNIQIADLNSLNASLAVIKWKKLSGFYQDLEREHHCSYDINVSRIFNEDDAA